MKIIVIGGTGIIGKAVVNSLKENHEVIVTSRTAGDYQLDIENKGAIAKMFEDIKDVDGIISTTGAAMMMPISDLTDEALDLALNNKMKAQINFIREGLKHLKKGGFITITTGTAGIQPFPGTSSISMACAGLEAFVKAVELENNTGIRINAIRPAMVTESAELFNMKVPFSVSAKDTAEVYKNVAEGNQSGEIVDVSSQNL
jgi:NAD(P)-dependent dehydrogenase (short-subunit alcohol dehydrogenase family)